MSERRHVVLPARRRGDGPKARHIVMWTAPHPGPASGVVFPTCVGIVVSAWRQTGVRGVRHVHMARRRQVKTPTGKEEGAPTRRLVNPRTGRHGIVSAGQFIRDCARAHHDTQKAGRGGAWSIQHGHVAACICVVRRGRRRMDKPADGRVAAQARGHAGRSAGPNILRLKKRRFPTPACLFFHMQAFPHARILTICQVFTPIYGRTHNPACRKADP